MHRPRGTERYLASPILISRERHIMKLFRKAAANIGVISELLTFFGSAKRWWLLPMLITLFLFFALIIVAQSSAVAPFVYTLF